MKISKETGLPELPKGYRWRAFYNGNREISFCLQKKVLFLIWKLENYRTISKMAIVEGNKDEVILDKAISIYNASFVTNNWYKDIVGTYPPNKLGD